MLRGASHGKGKEWSNRKNDVSTQSGGRQLKLLLRFYIDERVWVSLRTNGLQEKRSSNYAKLERKNFQEINQRFKGGGVGRSLSPRGGVAGPLRGS